jgi:hypothetical protein
MPPHLPYICGPPLAAVITRPAGRVDELERPPNPASPLGGLRFVRPPCDVLPLQWPELSSKPSSASHRSPLRSPLQKLRLPKPAGSMTNFVTIRPSAATRSARATGLTGQRFALPTEKRSENLPLIENHARTGELAHHLL